MTFPEKAIGWGRPLRLTGYNIRVANAPWGSTPLMFTAGHVELELDPSALLRLSLRIRRIALDDAAVFLDS